MKIKMFFVLILIQGCATEMTVQFDQDTCHGVKKSPEAIICRDGKCERVSVCLGMK